MSREDDRSAIKVAEAVARRSYGKLVAILAARPRLIRRRADSLVNLAIGRNAVIADPRRSEDNSSNAPQGMVVCSTCGR